jgi:hypothetical protein
LNGPPPALASEFTSGEVLVLRTVGDECRMHGSCPLHLDAIAAWVTRSVRHDGYGLITRQERASPARGLPSLTNFVRTATRSNRVIIIQD